MKSVAPDLSEYSVRTAAGGFLRIFCASVLTTAVIVSSINLIAYRYMLKDENQAIVQLLSGWGRVYKPILYDEIKPEVSVYGASWARDAFDPVETSRLLGKTLFNHAVSGGTAYETRRFVDSSLDNPNLETAIVNLNSFSRRNPGARFRYGFDNSVLDVDSEREPNRWVGLARAYSLALDGWAVAANFRLISTIHARDRGDAKDEYLESYQSADLTLRNMKIIRRQVFPVAGYDQPRKSRGRNSRSGIMQQEELEIVIDRFCNREIDIYAYYTPTHARKLSCDSLASEELYTLDFLKRKQGSCDAKIYYFNFAYPNAVTLEGVLNPVTVSRYYRPDGHPRPTVGLLMAARMFESEFPPGTPNPVKQDFGVDLLSHDNPEGWLLERAARCEGDWGKDGLSDYAAALLAD